MMTVLDRDPCAGDKRERVPATRLWLPRRVLVTPGALGWAHGRAMVRRAAALGREVVELRSDRLPSLTDDSPRQLYREAKSTLAVIVASPSRRRPQPIPPSADWRFDLAQGCPAHCHYCYLAGSLKGPPVTRVYANLPEILAELPALVGAGTVTSRSSARTQEGTTFEASCYTDPLGIEHLTGSLAATVRHFGAWQAPVQLRLTTKFDAVDPLLGIEHNRRTRVRFSVNAAPLSRQLEGGTAPLPARLAAMRRLALAGYPVGLTVAPIMPVDGWREAYEAFRRRRGGPCGRACARSHGRVHHPPLHQHLQRGPARLVPGQPARDGQGSPCPEDDQVRLDQACLSSCHDAGAARLSRGGARPQAALGAPSLLDLIRSLWAGPS
jgi:spore photoproduct lyase